MIKNLPPPLDATPPLRVMVVDDDEDINHLIRLRLASRGYTAMSATNGADALALIEKEKPDLVFLDIAMPGMSGLQVLEQVRAQNLDVAVIMTTAFSSLEMAIDALRRGADDYLQKPFEAQDFWAVMQRAVSRLQLERQNAALRAQLDEKRKQLERELARAGQVQQELLPQSAPALDGYDFAACCLPARHVGGDFYDWVMPAPGVLKFALVDVMGKGMPAALMMATTRAALRAVIRDSTPVVTLEHLCSALNDDLERSGGFVTLFLARLDTRDHTIQFVDAGHGLAFLRHRDGTIESLHPRGLPIGITRDYEYEGGVVNAKSGDALIIYSDGLMDARPDLKLTPARVSAALNGADSAQMMIDKLIALTHVQGDLPDDLTILVLGRK